MVSTRHGSFRPDRSSRLIKIAIFLASDRPRNHWQATFFPRRYRSRSVLELLSYASAIYEGLLPSRSHVSLTTIYTLRRSLRVSTSSSGSPITIIGTAGVGDP